MKLVITSDTHGFHRGMTQIDSSFPAGDVLIHCGDFSRDHGSWLDVKRFAKWMAEQPYEHKILCPGNHDQGIAQNPIQAEALFKEHGIHMLGKEMAVVDGVRFDGGPYMPVSGWDPPWGFEMSDVEREEEWGRIGRCDVLVTHTPPMGVLDQTAKGPRVGCPILRQKVFSTIRPRLHCFGHIHESRGILREEGIVFMNASCNSRGSFMRDDLNKVTHMSVSVRDPLVYDLNL